MSEEFELPRAVIQRLVKESLPSGIGISKDAKVAFGVAARIFVSFATATANELRMEANRKTLTASDVLEGLKEMDFEEFVAPLTANLDGFKAEQSRKKKQRATAAAAKEAKKESDPSDDAMEDAKPNQPEASAADADADADAAAAAAADVDADADAEADDAEADDAEADDAEADDAEADDAEEDDGSDDDEDEDDTMNVSQDGQSDASS